MHNKIKDKITKTIFGNDVDYFYDEINVTLINLKNRQMPYEAQQRKKTANKK